MEHFQESAFIKLNGCRDACEHLISFDETSVQHEESLRLSFAFGYPRFGFRLSAVGRNAAAGTSGLALAGTPAIFIAIRPAATPHPKPSLTLAGTSRVCQSRGIGQPHLYEHAGKPMLKSA